MRLTSRIALLFALSACGVALAQEKPSTAPAPTTTTVPATTTTTTPPTTTTTTLPPLTFTPKCPILVDIARTVGWPDAELEMLDRIMWRESRCDITADGKPRHAHYSLDPAGGSYGATQVNGSWCRKNRWNPHPAGFLGALGILDDCTDLWDWETNLRAAKALYDYSLNTHGWDHRWRPWYPLPKF